MKHRKSAALLLVTCCLSLSACMSGLNYQATSQTELDKIHQGQLATAFASGDSSDVLHNLELGSVKRMAQQYDQSNGYFAQAQAVIDVFNNSWKSTRTGEIGSDVASMLLNDNVKSYQLKGYEKTFLATFTAMNYLDLNNLGNARVAIKQMYENEEAIQNYREAEYNALRQAKQKTNQDGLQSYLYKKVETQYNFPDLNSPAVLKLTNSYQNAFGHYLAGFVFEALNEPSLARPGYVKAGQLNPTNALIRKSIANIDNNVRPQPGHTSLLIVQAVGHAPQVQSVQRSLPVQLGRFNAADNCIQTLNIFYPKLILDKTNQPLYAYSLDGAAKMPLAMTNVNLMAQRALKDEMPHIIMRNVVAMVRNIATARLACQADKRNNLGPTLNIGAALLGQFLDQADERTWVMLPAYININRVNLPYGKHSLTVNVQGAPHHLSFTLSQPYQVLAYRIVGQQVFFESEQSMEAQ